MGGMDNRHPQEKTAQVLSEAIKKATKFTWQEGIYLLP
jgi:hypothetical protein